MDVNLNLRDLVFFLTVEREGSFGRAATELVVTQPAVSERIRHLERVVGRPVFERTGRGAVLTPAGAALLPYARRCVALAQETIEAARQAEGAPALVIAVHSAFAQRVVPFVLGTLTTMPRRVAIRDVHSEVVPALLLDGIAHVGFALPGPVSRGLQHVSLPADPVVCVAAPDHPITQLRRPSLASLGDSLVAVNGWGNGFEAFAARLGAGPIDDWRVRYCGEPASAATLAAEHEHVAFVSLSSVAEDLRQGRLSRVPMSGISGWQVRVDMLHRRVDRNDTVVQALTAAAPTA